MHYDLSPEDDMARVWQVYVTIAIQPNHQLSVTPAYWW